MSCKDCKHRDGDKCRVISGPVLPLLCTVKSREEIDQAVADVRAVVKAIGDSSEKNTIDFLNDVKAGKK